MPKHKRHIEVVPVWRESVDRRLMLQALLALVEQLANETPPWSNKTVGEVSNG